MDPLSVTATIITLAGAVCSSHQEISKIVTLIRDASKELEGISSQAESVNRLVQNLQQALEENATQKAIEQDELALNHTKALDEPLKALKTTLDDVEARLRKQYRPSADGKQFEPRLRYYLTANDWVPLQRRLTTHIQVLSASMQGLNTLNVLRILGGRSKDPAQTLRTYASSIIEGTGGSLGSATLVEHKSTPLSPDSNDHPGSPLPLDERRLLAKRKLRLQRDLLQAAKTGDDLDVSLLLSEGAETEWTEEGDGKTALHHAARCGHIRVAKRLLDAGADLEAKSDAFGNEWIVRTETGRTPLIWAAAGHDSRKMQERMCQFLIEMGADVNARNVFCRTALQEAAMSCRFDGVDPTSTLELLIKHGAKVNAYDKNGWTALTECCFAGDMELAQLMLANGAYIDGVPGDNESPVDDNPALANGPHHTPLLACCEWSWDEKLSRLLLDEGRSITMLNKYGKNIAQMATEKNRPNVIEIVKVVEKA